MQVNLVFSPFAKPRLPLGIALLKPCVEASSNFHVQCFDLNAAYHNDLCDDIRNNNGQIKMSEQDRATFIKSVDVFSGEKDEFFNQAVYDSSAMTLFEGCFKQLNELFSRECERAFHENKNTPWFVSEYVDLLLMNKPDVVGFSIMFSEQLWFSLLAARMLKAVSKDIKIVFGGNLSTILYKNILIHPSTAPCVDFVVLNEGENAFVELLEAINGDREINEVSGVAFNNNGNIVVTEPSMVTDLNSIPFPDFSDFDLNSYLIPAPVIPVLGSRGCYWKKCTFCTHHESYFNKYRTASVQHVVDEIEFHVNNGAKYFDFIDEMIPAKRFKKIAEEITRRKLKINYFALAKPTIDFTKDIFDAMYKSGCRYIIWGVESGCQRTLDLMDKGANVKDISKVLEYSTSAGIMNHIFIIFGFPSETHEEFKETLTFIYENKENIHAIHNSIFMLFKSSLLYKDPEKFCITKLHEPEMSINPVGYDVSRGIEYNELKQMGAFYAENYFPHFNYFSRALVVLRDHALVLYSNPDKLRFNLPKNVIPLPDTICSDLGRRSLTNAG